jgi:hypothetical protein
MRVFYALAPQLEGRLHEMREDFGAPRRIRCIPDLA